MNSRKARIKVAGLITALVLTGAACGSDDTDNGMDNGSDDMTTTTASETLTPVGAACDQVPTEGEGSVEGMADDPVATAASNNPLLSTLVTAVGEAGLADTLNEAGPYTVFAPINSAFEKVPEADLNALLADQEQLTQVLTYHVVPQRLTIDELTDGASLTTAQGQNLTIAKDGENITVNDSAAVVCGNVPVANGVVMLIDTVLMPPEA